MKTISKKKLQKIANWLDLDIGKSSSGMFINETYMPIDCPELQPGEVIKPRPKWDYPIATEIPECGFVWVNYCTKLGYLPWDKRFNDLDLTAGYLFVLPDPNNPNKPPKKNWRPK